MIFFERLDMKDNKIREIKWSKRKASAGKVAASVALEITKHWNCPDVNVSLIQFSYRLHSIYCVYPLRFVIYPLIMLWLYSKYLPRDSSIAKAQSYVLRRLIQLWEFRNSSCRPDSPSYPRLFSLSFVWFVVNLVTIATQPHPKATIMNRRPQIVADIWQSKCDCRVAGKHL